MRALLILGLLITAVAVPVQTTIAQTDPNAASPGAIAPGVTRTIDGIAARIEGDIITDSQVRELGAFQQLLNGQSKSRDEIIRELADQWVVRQEAAATRYQQPSQADVDAAYNQLVKNFSSPADFQAHLAAAGLSDAAVRRLLRDQLYLSRFLDYRFRPAAEVSDKQVEDYYNDELVPELKKRGDKIPPLDDVDDKIREVLIQRAIDKRSADWLDETRARLNIQILSQEENP
jgi:parvulin-like peptidyl-prolyl isomerase